jgi:hypothetical protein
VLEQRVVDRVGAEALEHLHEVVAVGDEQVDLLPVEPGQVAEAEDAVVEQLAVEDPLDDGAQPLEGVLVVDGAAVGARDLEAGDVDVGAGADQPLGEPAGGAERHPVQRRDHVVQHQLLA